MMTAEIPAHTTTRTTGATIRCAAKNHKDAGEIVIHDRCGVEVAKGENGRLYDLRSNNFGPLRYVCFNSLHTCDDDMVRITARQRADALANGEIVKNATVTVIKGRKVPVGTTGTVIWIGSSYGQTRLGIRDADGTTHWTAASNVQVVTPPQPATADTNQPQPAQPAPAPEALPFLAKTDGVTADGISYALARAGSTVYVREGDNGMREIPCDDDQAADAKFRELAAHLAGR